MDQLKSELGGNLEDAVVAMMTRPSLYDARTLRAAMKVGATSTRVYVDVVWGAREEIGINSLSHLGVCVLEGPVAKYESSLLDTPLNNVLSIVSATGAEMSQDRSARTSADTLRARLCVLANVMLLPTLNTSCFNYTDSGSSHDSSDSASYDFLCVRTFINIWC